MPTSSNGWSASPDLAIRPLVIAGEPFVPGIRDNDDVFTVLQYVAQQLHERVEPIVRADFHQADDWGFSFRDNRNDPNSLSNHASGTAFDYNATRHPNGVLTRDTYTVEQIGTIHLILAEVDGAVRWGGDFNGTPDAMHFEINVGAPELARVAQNLRDEEEFRMKLNNDDLAAIDQRIAAAVPRIVEAVLTALVDNEPDKVNVRTALRRASDAAQIIKKKEQA